MLKLDTEELIDELAQALDFDGSPIGLVERVLLLKDRATSLEAAIVLALRQDRHADCIRILERALAQPRETPEPVESWLLEGLRDVKREADARPELAARVAAHPSGFIARETPEPNTTIMFDGSHVMGRPVRGVPDDCGALGWQRGCGTCTRCVER